MAAHEYVNLLLPLTIVNLKGTVHPKIKNTLFFLTCSAVYQSKLFRYELSSFGDIDCREFCLLSNIMEINGALNVVLKKHLKN